MALRTSVADGVWSDPDTWDTGVPQLNDDVRVISDVTLDVTPPVLGTVTIDATTCVGIGGLVMLRFNTSINLTADTLATLGEDFIEAAYMSASPGASTTNTLTFDTVNNDGGITLLTFGGGTGLVVFNVNTYTGGLFFINQSGLSDLDLVCPNPIVVEAGNGISFTIGASVFTISAPSLTITDGTLVIGSQTSLVLDVDLFTSTGAGRLQMSSGTFLTAGPFVPEGSGGGSSQLIGG